MRLMILTTIMNISGENDSSRFISDYLHFVNEENLLINANILLFQLKIFLQHG